MPPLEKKLNLKEDVAVRTVIRSHVTRKIWLARTSSFSPTRRIANHRLMGGCILWGGVSNSIGWFQFP